LLGARALRLFDRGERPRQHVGHLREARVVDARVVAHLGRGLRVRDPTLLDGDDEALLLLVRVLVVDGVPRIHARTAARDLVRARAPRVLRLDERGEQVALLVLLRAQLHPSTTLLARAVLLPAALAGEVVAAVVRLGRLLPRHRER